MGDQSEGRGSVAPACRSPGGTVPFYCADLPRIFLSQREEGPRNLAALASWRLHPSSQ